MLNSPVPNELFQILRRGLHSLLWCRT